MPCQIRNHFFRGFCGVSPFPSAFNNASARRILRQIDTMTHPWAARYRRPGFQAAEPRP